MTSLVLFNGAGGTFVEAIEGGKVERQDLENFRRWSAANTLNDV